MIMRPLREFVRSTVLKAPKLQVIGEVSDGLDAVRKAQELQPDLILIDIGLPILNGIEAARRIREVAPASKVLFVSENRSSDIAEEALRLGALGYVIKSNAVSELLPAVESVLQGKQFVSASLLRRDFTELVHAHPDHPYRYNHVGDPIPLRKAEIKRQHQVGFDSDDRWFLEDVTQFVGTALKSGNTAIVAATESHRNNLLQSFAVCGLDISTAINQGRYIALDAAEVLSSFMFNGMPDAIRFMNAFGNLIRKAAKATELENPRVAIFGECVQLLWAQGNAEAAIQMEELGNQLVDKYDIDILCGYSLDGFHDMMGGHVYQRICAEHSAIYSR